MSPNQTEILQNFNSPEVSYTSQVLELGSTGTEKQGCPAEFNERIGGGAVSATETNQPGVPAEEATPNPEVLLTAEHAAVIAAGLTARLLALRGRVTGQSGINR